jgi:O-acetyl-ADP-ribose deacetylase (regulator of RNase III)
VIEYRRGDLLTSGLSALAHGCNCQGAMGAGIARGFRDRWPDMYASYRELCTRGTYRPGDVFTWEDLGTGQVIYCLATQRRTGPAAEPWAVTAAVAQMIKIAHYDQGIREIGLPLIGCGIGGLTPEMLSMCLAPFGSAPVTLIVYRYAP